MSETSRTDATRVDVKPVDELAPRRLSGVRTARVIAFLVDYLIISLVSLVGYLIVGIVGIPTFGLAWGLLPFVFPAVALIYLARTLGGESQATLGMSLTNVSLYRLEGGRIDPFLAMLHGVLFWFLGWWSLPTTFFSSKKRLLHDIVLGTYVAKD